MLDFLREEKISPEIIRGIEDFRRINGMSDNTAAEEIKRPKHLYYSREVWEQAAAALLCGENIMLVGSKATGKNVLAENLAAAFGRPVQYVSFHINTDSTYMIGTDTFKDGEVRFRPGPVYICAEEGGFCILDEINMARNEALAVLHSILDFRRTVHIPGYRDFTVNPASRFIATMNYGYAGTRELNEALASRFVIIRMPEISEDNLKRLIAGEFPQLKRRYVEDFSGLFKDISKKSLSGEITSASVDLRGLLDAIRLITAGLPVYSALDMGITNKTFDQYEQTLIRDIISSRISASATREAMFDSRRSSDAPQ